jgi:uncharacterized membrane protein YkvA (DUF1232 family)
MDKEKTMRRIKQPIDKLEDSLRLAYRAKSVPEFSANWREMVMRDIRRLYYSAQNARDGVTAMFAFRRMILPFAAATSIVAVAFLILSLGSVMGIEYDIFKLVLEESAGLPSSLLLAGL